jgi:uncharacterized protein (DUF1697 family)
MRYAALLRGVNLGPTRKVAMADLRRALETSGLESVETYLRSGNVAFDSEEENRSRLLGRLEELLAAEFGFDIPVVVVTAEDLTRVVDANPYAEPAAADPTKVHVTFLEPMPAPSAWQDMEAQDFGDETFELGETWVYLHLPNGMGRASLPGAVERAVGDAVATTRNWRTVLRLVELAAG